MGASVGKKGFVSEINVTPFVDVMLVLLIIFMVTAPMMDQGLDVDLPETKQVDALPSDAEHLTLTVRKDGAIMLEGYSVPLEELESRLAVLAGEKGRSLFLQADTAVPYGVVVDVMACWPCPPGTNPLPAKPVNPPPPADSAARLHSCVSKALSSLCCSTEAYLPSCCSGRVILRWICSASPIR